MKKMISKIITASLGMAMMIGAAIGINSSKNAKEVNAVVEHSLVPFTGGTVNTSGTIPENNYLIYYGSDPASTSCATLGNVKPTKYTGMNSGRTNFNPEITRQTGTFEADLYRFIPTGDGYYKMRNVSTGKLLGYYSTHGLYFYDDSENIGDGQKWDIYRVKNQYGYSYYEFENIYKKNSNNTDYRANRFLRNLPEAENGGALNVWWMYDQQTEGPLRLFAETPIDHITASIVDGHNSKPIGSTLAASDFNVTVYWDSNNSISKAVTSGFTWTVNGVENGALSLGGNDVVVTYDGVQSSVLRFYGVEVHATSVTLNRTSLSICALGETYRLSATVEPSDVTDELYWTSLNPSVATVSDTGLVTAVSEGVATIKATSGSISATCNVSVYDCSIIELPLNNRSFSVSLDSNITQATINGYVMNFKNAHNNNGGYSYVELKSNSQNIVSNHTPIPGAIARVSYSIYSSSGAYYRPAASNTELTSYISSGNTIRNNIGYITEVPVDYNISNNYHFFGISNASGYKGQMTKIKIYYKPSIVKDDIKALDTQTSLAYRYQKDNEGNFTYSDMSIRFGAVVSKATWNELNLLYGITGFGVMISSGNYVRDYQDFDDFAATAIEPGESVYTDINSNVVNYFVPVADMNETIGVDGDNYFWNLRWSVDPSDMDKTFSAAPYIKVGDEYVFLKKERTCITYVAIDYMNNRDCDETTAGGSLQNIVDQSQFE